MISIKKVLSKLASDDNLTEKKTLLWTNPNPTGNFDAQTINSSSAGWVGPSNLSGYSEVEISFINDQSEGCIAQILRVPIGKNGIANEVFGARASADSYARSVERHFTVSTSGVTFDLGWFKRNNLATGTSTQTLLIPYKIYGIKLGGGGRLKRLLKTFSPRKEEKNND